MASVVFIVRVPYEEEDPESSSTDGEGQPKSSDRNKNQGISGQTSNDHHRSESIKKVNGDNNEKETFQDSDQNTAEFSGDTSVPSQTADDVEMFTDRLNLAETLTNELRSLNVQGDSWSVTKDKQFHHVVFLERTGERVERVLAKLTSIRIGQRPKSSVSIIPTSVHIQPQENNRNVSRRENSNCGNVPPSPEIETQPLLAEEESTKDQFKKTIKSRLTVEQVVESIKMEARLTFDFVMFTFLASLIAAVALAEDNAVVLVASLLVSPLMGPILGGTFGTVIKNKSLRNTGLKTELCGLIISVVVGFLFSLICCLLSVNGALWYGTTKGGWPTQEMTSRGMVRGLVVGVLIALPSGAAVALSVLGGNTRSLVGVAISASLLSPAVNSGMLWACSIFTAIKPPELLDSAEFNTSTSKCPPFKDNSYMPTYSCDMGTEAAIMATISLVLTVVNIICIFITATLILKLKEVVPKASSSNATQTFWTKDIKVARETYKTIKGDQATNVLKEWKEKLQKNREDPKKGSQELLNLVEEFEETEEFQSVVRRAPRGAQNLHKFSRNLKRLVSREYLDETSIETEKEAMNLHNHLRSLQSSYSLRHKNKARGPHVGTIFHSEPATTTDKGVKEFHVSETGNPHHTSVVSVRPPNEDSNTYSVKVDSKL